MIRCCSQKVTPLACVCKPWRWRISLQRLSTGALTAHCHFGDESGAAQSCYDMKLKDNGA